MNFHHTLVIALYVKHHYALTSFFLIIIVLFPTVFTRGQYIKGIQSQAAMGGGGEEEEEGSM